MNKDIGLYSEETIDLLRQKLNEDVEHLYKEYEFEIRVGDGIGMGIQKACEFFKEHINKRFGVDE